MTECKNTLQAHAAEYARGEVTRAGFAALDAAEGYGAASSVGTCSACLAELWTAAERGERLRLYDPAQARAVEVVPSELGRWCERYLPGAYAEYRRRRAERAARTAGRWQRLKRLLSGARRR